MKTPLSLVSRASRRCTVVFTALALALPSGPATAADVFWSAGSGTGFSWSDFFNWIGDIEPGVDGDVIFPKPIPDPGMLGDPQIISLSIGELANSLSLFAPYTLTGGTLALSSGEVRVTIGNASTIESMLTGAGGLIKSGDGALKLSNGTNDYTGTTQIDAGSVIITAQSMLGTDTSAVIVTGNTTRSVGGGSLVVGSANNNLTGLTFTRDLALTGGGASGDGAAFNSVGNNIFTGNIVTGGNVAGLNPIGGTAITASGTRLASTFGTTTLNGALTVDPSGQATEFTGNGNWIVDSSIDGAGGLIKTGAGLLVLSGNNTFGGVLQLTTGFVRVSSQANLGASLANNAIFLTNGGKIEFRTDTPDFTTSKRVQLNTGTTTGTLYLDREIGGSGLNQTVNLGLFTLGTSTSTRTLNIDGRNGYNLQFNGNMATAGHGSFTVNNTGNGLFTNSGNFWSTNRTTASTLTFGNNGDFLITGGIIATGAAHVVTKTGTGTLTLNGTNSSFSGTLNVNGGTVAINDFRAITNNTSVIDIGTTTTTATLSIIGNNLSGANVTTDKVINLGGTTGGAIILANQTGTSPGVRFNANFTATGGTAANAKTVTLGGSNAQDNTIVGIIPNNNAGGTVNLLKIDAGTWVLAGANTYTGTTTITNGILKLEANAASSTILGATNAITFGNNNVNAGGTLELVGQANVNNVQALGTLTYASSGGAATVKLTPGLLGTASLTFANIGTGAGGTVNFVGGDFTTNTFTLTQVNAVAGSNGIVTRSMYWNGADFAYREGGVLRAPVYGTDAGTVTSATTLTAGQHNEITGSFTTPTGALSISTLKINGAHTLTLDPAQTLTISAFGLLATGGSSTITGGTALTVGGTATLVARVDGGADTLRIETVLSGFTGGITKSGAGTLVLAGANTQTGTFTIAEGTVRLADSGTLGGAAALTMRQGTTLDLNGISLAANINAFNSNGTITNGNATAVTLTVGGANGTGTSNGLIEDGVGQVSVTKLGTGGMTWNMLSTYTGVTTIGSTGIVITPNLANIGSASSLGAGDSSSDATNAASLVFDGASATQVFGGINYNGRDSISIDRLFTFGGIAANSGARIQANGANDSTLIFSNSGALAFGTTNIDQGLVLGGASIGSNQFNPLITDNGTGVVSLYKSDAGLWILGNTANSYTGVTQINAGALRAEGTTLSATSTLVFNGGVLQAVGTFTRSLTAVPAAGAGGVNWSGNGGFAAATDKLTVNIGGNLTPDTLTWGTGGFVSGTLILSSTTAFAEVEIVNRIDLAGAVRTVQVDTNPTTNSDQATLSGVINGAAGSGLTKTGSGILRLIGDNTYAGDTAINAGTVRAVSIGNSLSTSSNFGDGTGKISLNNATLAYVGAGETSDRLIELAGTTSNVFIESSGTGALILSNVVNVATGTVARTLFLRGDLNAANEITNALTNGAGSGALNVTKDDNGTWILSGQSTFTGNMTVSAGPLGISADSVGAVGAVTSSPVGVTRLIISNGSLFALDGDRTLNTLVRLNSNASSNFIGVNSITLNDIETTTGGTMTVTNSLATGKLLTLNSPTFTGTEATTARTFVFNGSGDTILNASVTNSTGGAAIALTYNGYGSLTLGGSNGASTYTGATTITSGTLKVGSVNAIPNGATASDVTMNPGAGLTATLDLNGFDQTVNGLIANSAGTANIDNSSATAATFTFGSQDQAANLIGGVTNSGGGALSLVKIGTAAATMNQGPFTYTGTTTVNGGSLIIASDVNGTTGITVGAGAFLAFTEGLSGSALITSVDVGAGGELRFLNSAGEPLSNLTSLTLGAGTTLGLNAGATSDTLTLLAPNIASVAGAVGLRIRDTGSMLGSSTYNLLEAASGGLTSGGGVYSLTAIPGGFTTLTLNQVDTLVSLTTGTLVSDKRYWTGATNNVWNEVNGTFDGLNWSALKDGSTVSEFIPGSGTTVVFSADNAVGGALVTTMEQGLRINALEFESSTGGATSVTIAPGADMTNRLIISPSASTDGINLKSGGPGAVTISAPLRIDAAQTWTVADSTSTLTLSGGLSGPGALTIDGPGTTIVSAVAGGTFAVPTVLVNDGTLRIENVGALGSTIVGNAAVITINPGAAFYQNGPTNTVTTAVNNDLTLAGGTLSAGGSTGNHYYTGAVNVTADSFINLRDSNSATVSTAQTSIILNGALTGTGKISLDSNSGLSGGNQFNGNLFLQADNSGWSGGFDITRGTIQVQNLAGFGTGNVTASAGRIIFAMPANNTVNLAQDFTVDAPGGILELSVDASGTLSGDLTVNVNGVVTLGSVANANNALRISQSSDNFSILNITNSIVLGNDASISYQGNASRPFEISGIISETGGARSLAINDELGVWAVTSRTIRLSGANTFTGDLTIDEGALEFSTVSNIGGLASNLGQGSAISIGGATLSFIGSTNQTTNRTITQTGAAIFAANGTGGATITYSGNVTAGANNVTLTGSGEGFLNGAITQTGTTNDFFVDSGIWHLGGTGSTIADDVFVNATSTGTAVLNLDTPGTLSWTAGTSNGLYARNGGVINLNADDVNGVGNSGQLTFILLGTDTNGDAGILNTNTFNIETPRLDLGNTPASRVGIITGTGSVTSNDTGTAYSTGFRLYEGSISANLVGVATLLKSGVGTVTLSGDNSGLTGTVANTRVDAGTLILDYTNSNTQKLSSARAVDMRGSTIQIVGSNSAATTETFNNLTLGAGGANKIQVTGGTGQDAVLNLGSITRANNASDGTMRFILPGGVQSATNGIRTTSPNSTFGLLGNGTTVTSDSAYATVDDGTGVWFATNSGGNIVALASTVKDDVTTWLPGEHITDMNGFSGTLLCADVNSLRFDAAAGSDLSLPDGGVLTINSGGILVTSNVGNSPSIQGGTLSAVATEIIITQDSAATFEISSDIRTNHALTKTGSGTLLLTGNNVYTGETEIQEGTLQVNGSSIGDNSTVTLADDHVATLQLLASESIGRLSGGVNTAGLDDLATVDIGAFTLTINSGTSNGSYAGKIVGSGVLIKNNSGTNTNQAFSGANTGFNGTVIINGGLFQLNNIGSMNATDYTINSGGSLLIDNNGTTTSGARILDTATITLNSADGAWSNETRPSGLAIRRDQNSTQSETVGVITVRSGASYARLDSTNANTAAFTEIIANNILRQNSATLSVRGTNLGNSSGRRTRLRINDATNQTAFISAMIGGGGATGTNTQSIVPWAIAEFVTNAAVGDGNMGNSLATYVSGQGFRALSFATDYTTIAAAAANNNVRESLGADLTGIAGRTINSLVINNTAFAGLDVTGTGAGQTLVNTSGTFLFTVTGGAASTAYDTTLDGFDDGITTGTGEYVFFVQNPTSTATTSTLSATITSNLITTADITKSGRGALILSGTNTAGGGVNKTTLNEGILEIANLGNIGGVTGDLVFAGGTLRLGTGLIDDISQRTIILLNAGGTIDTNGVDLALGNSVGSGLGGITKTGLGNLTLNAAATYSGPTLLVGGTLTIGANDATGTGDLSIGAGATLDLGVNGITAGLVTTSGASPVINGTGTITASTGFFFNNTGNITVDALLAGSGGLLKTQTNVLTLTGANTYTGTTEIQNGTLSFDSIANVGGASALGAPITVEDGIIRTGLSTADPVLTYTGSGHSTDRIIEMQGVAGGNLFINSDGTGALNLGRIQTATGGNKILTLGGEATGFDNMVAEIKEVGSALSVTKAGAGTWQINGANTYTGATSAGAGTLRAGNNLAFSSSAVTLANTGSILEVADGVNVANSVTVSDTGNNKTLALQSGATSGTSSGNIAIAETTAGNFDVSADTNGTLNLTGIISGAGGLEKVGAGTVVLTSANTYAGATTVTAGILQLGDGAATGSINTASAISVASGATFAVNQTDTVTQGTEFSGAAITGDGGFAQVGTGTTVLTADNDYTGTTTVSAGILSISSEENLGDNPGSFNAGQLTLNGGTLQTTATFSIDDTNRGVTIGASGGTIETGAATVLTVTNDIVTTGNLTKTGTGTLLVNSDSNSGSGTTTVSAGTLGGTGTISGAATVEGGATLTGATTGTTGELSFSGALTMDGGSIWLVDLVNQSTIADSITVGGLLALGGSLNIVDTGVFANDGSIYTIATYGSLSGAFSNVAFGNQLVIGGGQWLVTDTGTAITLTAVPEPGTLGLLGLALAGFFGRRIRRRRIGLAQREKGERS